MFKKFTSYYKPHRKLLFFDLLAASILSMVDLIFPMISREMINDYIPNGILQCYTAWHFLYHFYLLSVRDAITL
jgi:ATP-binding cassette, subfamily B, bacterial